MTTTEDRALSPEDMAALRTLVDAYADAVDRRDGPALRHLFTDDGRLMVQTDGGAVENEWSGPSLPGLLETLAAYDCTLHHVGGSLLKPAGDGATGRTTCVAHHYQRTGNGPVDLVMMVRYHDRFVHTPQGWRFAERRVAAEWTELHPAHPRRR